MNGVIRVLLFDPDEEKSGSGNPMQSNAIQCEAVTLIERYTKDWSIKDYIPIQLDWIAKGVIQIDNDTSL